jgi:hypothetical protein
MAKQVIEIGTKVVYRKKSNGSLSTARVVGIEECECGEKYGEPIDKVAFDRRTGDFGQGNEYTFNLDNNHWCYGEEILKIVED